MGTKKCREGTVTGAETGVALTQEVIEEFLAGLAEKGYVPGTLERYRQSLEQLRASLTGEKRIGKGTLALCRRQMLEEGYAPRTVNLRISAANSLLEALGLREYQLIDQVKPPKGGTPQITRAEYLQLLRAARQLGRERAYLLAKLFASTGLPLQELPKVTVEAVQAGAVLAGEGHRFRIPACLQRELLQYARRNGLLRGPVFLTREGEPMSRSNVTAGLRQLCAAAGLPEEKGSPRCLKQLYQSTREQIESNISLLVEQAQDRLLEAEQASIGWQEESLPAARQRRA